MPHHSRIGRAVVFASIVFVAAGCQRNERATPPAEVQSQAVQPSNQNTTVVGCLKAGDAPEMFVVTAARTEGSNETATYQLVSGTTGVNLTEHVGRRVEVSGTIRQSQELASRSRAQGGQPAGTSGDAGKPVVETRTEVDIKRLEVSTVKALGERCE